MLNLEQFRASATETDVATFAQSVDLPEGVSKVWVYAGICFLCEMTDGRFYCLLERDEFYGTRDAMESELFGWYQLEGW